MMNEINALIWPSPDGIGVLDQDTLAADVDISLEFDILTAGADRRCVPNGPRGGGTGRDRR